MPASRCRPSRSRPSSPGSTNPWDVKPIGGGRLLITERDSARLLIAKGGTLTTVDFPSENVWVSGRDRTDVVRVGQRVRRQPQLLPLPGLHEEVRRPRRTRRFVALQRHPSRRPPAREWLRQGHPATSGRHGGCRLLETFNGALLVGTGDAADETNTQNRKSLGGKVLRLDHGPESRGRPTRG